jgi:hypothetical protein
MSSKTYTYDKSSIGKIMSTFEGNFGWDTLHEVFHLDSKDSINKPLSYSLQVSLVGDAANVTVGQVTKVECMASVALAKSTYTKLSSPRAFQVSLSAEIQPILSGSVLKANLKSIKATKITLVSGTKQITLSSKETMEYLTYSNLFLQLKN